MKKALVLLVYILIISCKSEELVNENVLNNEVYYVYSPTQCAEKWQFEATNKETLANISNYLKENGILVTLLQISEPDGKIYCQACTCPSGRVITVKALDYENGKKLIKLGFVVL